MDEKKRQRYLAISEKLTELVGGKDNIQGVAHCATRLRIVLENNDTADLKAIEDLDLAKGVFVAGDQLQIIFGAGLVNDVYEVFTEYTGKKNMSLSDLKTEANKKMNPLQRIIKALSDVFIDIMPGILAAALLTGLSGVLANVDLVQNSETLFGITRLINISSGAIFGFLPLAVAYSACKRFGGRPILGIVMGCIMLSPSLADAYAAAQGTVEVTTLHLFGLGVDLVGFQGGIIVALLMGMVTAKLDLFFEKKVPEVIRLLVSPLLTTLVGALLLFTIIGPLGRGLASGITSGLVWMTQNLSVLGYALFSGVQQLVVITGLHHIFGAIEAQLLADPAGNGYVNYVIAHVIALAAGFVMTLILSGFQKNAVSAADNSGPAKSAAEPVIIAEAADYEEGAFLAYTAGRLIAMEDVNDETFRNKVLGDGVAIKPEAGAVYAPVNGTVASVFETKHAICLVSDAGEEILIHIGIDTVNLNGEHFTAHVKDGDKVKAGQLLIEFDLKKIGEKGYDTVIPMIFTDPDHQPDMSGWELREVRQGERL